jgi:hypothetical protein
VNKKLRFENESLNRQYKKERDTTVKEWEYRMVLFEKQRLLQAVA